MDSGELLLELESESETRTLELGQRLGAVLEPRDGIALGGELGAGKTVFVRGLARGLGIDDPSEVRSPTYLLMVEHPGPVPLLHMDAYFAQRGSDFLADGGQAYLSEGAVVAIEWADRLLVGLPAPYLRLEIQHVAEESRRLVFHGASEIWSEKLLALRDSSS